VSVLCGMVSFPRPVVSRCCWYGWAETVVQNTTETAVNTTVAMINKNEWQVKLSSRIS
jgi:hypothetical protein